MKILKTILIIIASLFILFALLGVIKPTVDYGHSVNVNKSVQEAWAVADDPAKHAEWLDGFISETLLSGEQGQVGSKYKVVVKPSPEEPEFVMTETITSRQDNDHLSMHFETDFGTFDQTMRFEGDSTQATVSTESSVSSGNFLMRSMFAAMEMLTGSFQQQEEKHLNQLKKVIEANTTDYFSAKEEAEGT